MKRGAAEPDIPIHIHSHWMAAAKREYQGRAQVFKRLRFSQAQRQNLRTPETWFQAGTAWCLSQVWSAAQKHVGMEMHLQLRRLLRAVEEEADPKEFLTRMLEVYANVEGQSGHDEEAQEEEGPTTTEEEGPTTTEDEGSATTEEAGPQRKKLRSEQQEPEQ